MCFSIGYFQEEKENAEKERILRQNIRKQTEFKARQNPFSHN